MIYYLDTSALTKLVLTEAESDALRAAVATPAAPMVTSAVARCELLRAVLRRAPDSTQQAREVLGVVRELLLTAPLLERAGLLPPAALRSLDAVHVASALALGPELRAFVTYDNRQRAAAEAHGLPTLAPG